MPGTVVCYGVPAGLTLTASLFPDGSDTAAATGVSVTAATNRKSTYSFSTTLTGLYLIQLLNGSNCVWVGWAVLAASGTIEAEDSRRIALNLDSKISEIDGGGSSLNGANTVTITITDGTDPLENVKVRVRNGGQSEVKATNASGVVTFSLDNATWLISATLSHFASIVEESLIVNGDESATYEMTAISITPSDPGRSTGVLTCFGSNGEIEPEAAVYLKLHKSPAGTGLALDSESRVEIADDSGVVQFTNLFRGAVYHLRRGAEDSTDFVVVKIAADAADSIDLNNVIGNP